MKIGVAFYYKNIWQYPAAWVQQCIDSMRNQTYKDFDVYELNYSNNYLHNSFDFAVGKGYHYEHKALNNHAEAMNYIYSAIFKKCDVAVNTNIDDFYDKRRIELLLKTLNEGADIASSNYFIIDADGKIIQPTNFANQDIYKRLKQGDNIISNPSHVMRKRVFEKMQFDPSLLPKEDMIFWHKAIEAGFKLVIRSEFLHYYRVHPGQLTNRKEFS